MWPESVPFLSVITVIGALSPLLGVKITYLADRTDLFRISNLVYGRNAILMVLGK
jgi:hypothetical protein